MSKILTYKQFSEVVPKRTKEFVDKFLSRLRSFDDILSNESSTDLDVIKSKVLCDLFAYVYNDYDSSISNILHNNYEDSFDETYYLEDYNNEYDTINIENTFNMLNEIFCVFEYEHEYYTLIPETILINNLEKINDKWQIISKYLEIKNIVSEITLSPTYLSNLRDEEKIVVKSENLKLENDTFDNLSIETILYLKKANKISRVINPFGEKNDYNLFDVSAISLLLTFYDMPNLKQFKNYFSSIGFEKKEDIRNALNEVDCDIKIPNLDKEYEYNYNITALVYRFKPYIDELKKIENDTPRDVISMLFDRKISNSTICEQIFKYSNPDLDLTKINENIEGYLKNQKKFEKDEVYKNLPLKICEYFEFISKIVYVLKEKNSNRNFNVYYQDSEIIEIAIFISSFYKDSEITLYLLENDISLDKVLNYLNLTKEDMKFDIDKEKCDIVEIYNWFEDKFTESASIRSIILYIFSANTLNKILSDLSENHINIHSKSVIEKYIKNKNEQKRIDALSKFYGDLNIDIVKLLESSYIYYKYLLKTNKKYDLTNDDLIQISLLLVIYKISSNDLSKYVYEDLFSQKLLKKLTDESKIDVDSYKNIFNKNIDAKEFCSYFGKYIFGGKNKDKLKKDITINDILNNLFNKDLNYSIKMKNFLSNFNLTYEDFENLNEKYKEYLCSKEIELKRTIKGTVLRNITGNGNFDIVDDIDKLSRTLENEKDEFFSPIILIYMFYRENSFSKYLIDEGITLDKILEYFKLSKEKIDKFKDLDTDYNHIYNGLFKKFKLIFYKNFDNIIEFIFRCLSRHYTPVEVCSYDFRGIREVITNLGGNFDIIEYEIENGEKYIPPLTKEEQLEEYLKLPVPKIEIKNAQEISNFGFELSNQSEFISQTFSEFIDNYSNESEEVTDLQEDFKDIYKEKTKGRKLKFFAKKNEEENNQSVNKKEILDRLDNYLRDKEKNLNDGLKELQYIRSLIAAYLQKAKEYLKECESAKEKLTLEINNKKYYENDFRVFDDNLRMQLIDDKISNINVHVLQMIQQYQKITMQMGTHATLINQVNLARSSTIQNLYIELSLREGIEKEKDSISSLNTLIGLLGNMSEMNSSEMINNIKKINMLSKNEENMITDKDKELIDQILDEQKILKLNKE